MDRENERLVNKSIEAFLMGIEIYNKPTIKYRVEGFSFFIVNAWELLLKAEMIKRGIPIYYKDQPNRTISSDVAVKKIYTDKHTRIRLNLEKIIELRNISTHYITEDYEAKYVPLFQSCVLNYVHELSRFQNIDISEKIAPNFLTLPTSYEPLTSEQIRLKYAPEIAEKFIQQANDIDVLSNTYNSEKFAINVRQNLYITKSAEDADFKVAIAKSASNNVAIIKDLKDPSNTHKYTFINVVTVINERLTKENIKIDYDRGFNSYILNLIINFYNVKENPNYAYNHKIGDNERYTYSQQFVDFVFDEIKKAPDKYVTSLKKSVENKR